MSGSAEKIRILTIIVATVVGSALSGAALAQNTEMPTATRFPAEAAFISCADEASGRRMLTEFHGVRAGSADEMLLERGLNVTGCRRDTGPFRVTQAFDRREASGTRLLFKGRREGRRASPLVGIVNLTEAIALPQTQFIGWLDVYAPGGRLSARSDDKLVFRCPDLAVARRVVAAIPETPDNPLTTFVPPTDRSPFERALAGENCTRTKASFRVIGLHERARVVLPGRSQGENWVALSAEDSDGRAVGLLHDDVRAFYARRAGAP
jgi:hypothetical protein